jgi:hypothetical protein
MTTHKVGHTEAAKNAVLNLGPAIEAQLSASVLRATHYGTEKL